MGQCTSNKSTHIQDITKKKNTSTKSKSKHSEKMDKKNKPPVTKGQVTRFGFKKPPQVPAQPPLPSIPGAVTKETIEPLVISPPIKQDATKRKESPSTNRFGFRPPSTSNKISDIKTNVPSTSSKLSGLKLSKKRSASETRFSQNDYKLASGSKMSGSNSSLNSHENRPTSLCTSLPVQKNQSPRFGYTGVDKRAKTIANNKTVIALNQNKLTNKNNESVMKIQELQNSPSLPRKIRHDNYPSRANHREMIFNAAPGTRFDLRDLIPIQPENKNAVKTDNNQHNNVASKIRETLLLPTTSTMADEYYTEEKQQRDRKTSEKISIQSDMDGEDFWNGPGEAMAAQDGMIESIISDIDNSPESMNPPLRSVLLTVESGTFATLAAGSFSGMLEDEASPESPDISCSSPSSFDPLPPPPAIIAKGSNPGTPETPGSPTRTNSSSSDTKDRDFLIDDEIADQPGLVFDTAMDENSLLDISRTRMARLTTDVSRVLANVDLNSVKDQETPGRHNSTGTLSPCDSIASDDLMLEFDKSEISVVDESQKNSSWKSEFIQQSDQMYKEWTSILTKHPRIQEMKIHSPKKCLRKTSRGTSKSRSNEHSPMKQPPSSSPDSSDDSGIKLDKDTVDEMLQCLKSFKSQLLHLQNVLVELVLLELEREEKNWQIAKLREELKKLKQNDTQLKKPMRVNVATQTERYE